MATVDMQEKNDRREDSETEGERETTPFPGVFIEIDIKFRVYHTARWSFSCLQLPALDGMGEVFTSITSKAQR